MYKISFEGKQIDLPKYSVLIAKKIEELGNLSGDLEFKLKTMYDFIKEIIGNEKTEEVLKTFNEADPNDINIIFNLIVMEYNRPFETFQRDKKLEFLQNPELKFVIENIDKIAELNKEND